jgi:hypothetical protein
MIRIGDKVVYRETYREKDYDWKLVNNDEYTVTNRAFDRMGLEEFISVKWKDQKTETCWYNVKDFIKTRKLRKLKLKKINKNYGN